MKPTCPPSRRLNPPGASDPKNKAAAAAESCLPTNSSAGEIVKSVGTKAEIGFSQSEVLHNSSEFGKLNPEAPATGLTTGEQPNPILGGSNRKTTMNNKRTQEVLSNQNIAGNRPPQVTAGPGIGTLFGLLPAKHNVSSEPSKSIEAFDRYLKMHRKSGQEGCFREN